MAAWPKLGSLGGGREIPWGCVYIEPSGKRTSLSSSPSFIEIDVLTLNKTANTIPISQRTVL